MPPLGGTPRLPALDDRLPSKGAPAAGPRRRSFVEPPPGPTPCEAGWRPNPSRSSAWSPVAGWTPTLLTFASRASFVTRPFARGKSVVGPPVTRWADSLGFPSLVDSARRCEQRAVLAYSPFGSDPFGPEGPTGASPRARRPVAGTPFDPDPFTTRAVKDTVSRSPEPVELSSAGVSFESRRFG